MRMPKITVDWGITVAFIIVCTLWATEMHRADRMETRTRNYENLLEAYRLKKLEIGLIAQYAYNTYGDSIYYDKNDRLRIKQAGRDNEKNP